MNITRKYLFVLLLIPGMIALAQKKTFVKADALKLIEHTATQVSADAGKTLTDITAGVHPYKDKDDPSIYVFVYDTDVKIVAHPKSSLVGKSYKGKPDIFGTKFRDQIVNGALKKGEGGVTYFYQKTGTETVHKKRTYYKKVTGSDGSTYVVCCGIFAAK